jgi:restriction system protein
VYLRTESLRIAALDEAREQYIRECERRESEARESNLRLDTFIANLSYGVPDAVQEYVSIVLANSSYPEHFPVSHAFEFDPNSAELNLRVSVPPPDTIPEVKAYKYTKSNDEIVESTLSQKACRDRYAGAVHQVALRSIHEVFESDRRAVIKTISLIVGTEAKDPATGVAGFIPLVCVGAEREAFLKFDLSGVVPAMTLSRLGAAMAKNPYGLEGIESSGIRLS